MNQSYFAIELIIVNDGSTDDSDKIIRTFSDSRVIYIQQNNMGQCVASNNGYKKSSGSLIKFFDVDDIMNPEHIEEQIKALGDNKNALSSCAWGRFFEGDINTVRFIPEENWKDMEPLKWLKSAMSRKYDMMPVWLWLIPRQVIERAGQWNETLTLNNDFEFSIRLLMHASYVYFAANAKIFYRSGRQTSLSSINSEKDYQAAILSSKMGCSYLLEKEDSKDMRLLCANKFSFWLYYIYPNWPNLIKELENEIDLLGGTNRKIDESALMHMLQKLIGWKAAKRFKNFMYKSGYKPVHPALRKNRNTRFNRGS